MIQIIGLRPYFNKQKGKQELKQVLFDIEVDSVSQLFLNSKEILEQIPVEERWNIFYTYNNSKPGKPLRRYDSHSVMVFDIDGINTDKLDEYIEVICKVLQIHADETGIVASGNGLHLIIGLEETVTDKNFYNNNRAFYKGVVSKINKSLEINHLPGGADTQVFDAARILRLPGTINRKKNKPEKECRLLQASIVPRYYDLKMISGIPEVSSDQAISTGELKRYPPPDTEGVLKGCDFLKYCQDNPLEISEPEWYAMLGVVSRLDDGVQKCHKLSKPHPDYTRMDTDQKIQQALKASGPRLCSSIQNLSTVDHCTSCKYYMDEKIISPILIKTENYIATSGTKYHGTYMTKEGVMKYGKPNYEDLRRAFEKKNKYITTETNWVYVWDGMKWKYLKDTWIEAFAQECFEDLASTGKVSEFVNLIHRTNKVENSFFDEKIQGCMNMQNGIYIIEEDKLIPHSRNYGFTYVLPYDYDPSALCPTFNKFMDDITVSRETLKDVLMEFAGYAFSYSDYKHHKCLILTGEGSNGKSTFMDVLKELAGPQAYSSLMLNALNDDAKRYEMLGKLFNIAEETPKKGLEDSSIFKILTSGGSYTVKQLYKQPYTVNNNRTKIIMACNELPRTLDFTKGMFRRLMIVPFDAVFEGTTEIKGFKNELFKELPGIFNLVIEGYRRLLRQNDFTESVVITEENEKYRKDSDFVVSWFEEACEVVMHQAEAFLTTKELYLKYISDCDEIRQRPIHLQSFSKRLSRIVPQKAVVKRKNNKTQRGYRYIRFTVGNEF